jgi:hypothetical protein
LLCPACHCTFLKNKWPWPGKETHVVWPCI